MTQKDNSRARPQKEGEYKGPILTRVDYETGPDGEGLVPEAKRERKTLEGIL